MTFEIPEVGQVDALQVSAQSADPLADETDRGFVIRRLPDANEASTTALAKLQNQLDARDLPALVHDLREVHLQSTHWMVRMRGKLIKETRYLIHDKYLSRNFNMIKPNDAITLDPLRIWILGANYAPGNYWHWHAQSLPAILHALETVPAGDIHRVSILSGQLTSWQRDGLAALGLSPDQVLELPRGQTVHLDRLLYSDLLSSRQVFGQNRARERTAAMLRRAALGASAASEAIPGPRLYISRRDSGRRPLTNEPELSDELMRVGFAPVTNTDSTLMEQIRMYHAADIVVAPHGAGSTNLLFMQPGSSFVELQQASHVNAGPLSLGKTSALVPYAEVFSDDGRGQATEGWTVDVERALSLVDTAIDNQRSASRLRY